MQAVLARLAARLTYADVVATLALFVSLGGASYAVVSLPAHSVGQRQLADRAVTPRTLAFPLEVRTFTNSQVLYLPPPSRCPLGECEARLTEQPLGHMGVRRAGKLFVEGTATVEDEGPPGVASVALFVDGHRLDERTVRMASGGTDAVPLQGVTSTGPGTASVGFGAVATYDEASRRRARVKLALVAIALPGD